MKNTVRAHHDNGSNRSPAQAQPLSNEDKMSIFKAVNKLETAALESMTFAKLMTDHFLNQSNRSLRIDVDKEHKDMCFGCAILAETIADQLRLATRTVRDSTSALYRESAS